MTDKRIIISSMLSSQRDFFKSGRTFDVKFRISALKKLYSVIQANEDRIFEALKADLGKSRLESYMCEVGMTLSEISYMIKHIESFSKKRKVKTPIAQFRSDSYVIPTPYGNVLIMSPWNYPFLLTLGPLVDAVAAGNTVILKPSAYSPNTSVLIKDIIDECFPPEYVSVVTGGREENKALLDERFDLIFFTGSGNVGKEVLRHAAENLTPVILELGGKSPCIVDETANIPLAAKRIVFGKYLNCGQTCIAPDYILCHESVKESFIGEVKKQIALQFGEKPLDNPDYGKIINQKHFERLLGLIDKEKTVFGGESNEELLKISPTVMDNVTWDDDIMKEEIFGPLMPILTFKEFDEIYELLYHKPKPLALYLFSENKERINRAMQTVRFGGGCVNDVIIHLATTEMGFGGVGESGMGAYHGKTGFEAFCHRKSIVDKKTFIDLGMRYQPYSDKKLSVIRSNLK